VELLHQSGRPSHRQRPTRKCRILWWQVLIEKRYSHGLACGNSTQRSNPFGGKVKAQPFNFSNPALLEQTLRGVNILINNYWVRFDLPPLFTHAGAVLYAKTLFEAAKRAGVTRIVHISITNPDRNSEGSLGAGLNRPPMWVAGRFDFRRNDTRS
jgi:hypothetical protein